MQKGAWCLDMLQVICVKIQYCGALYVVTAHNGSFKQSQVFIWLLPGCGESRTGRCLEVYAIIETGGKQYRVSEISSELKLECVKALLLFDGFIYGDDNGVKVGTPLWTVLG